MKQIRPFMDTELIKVLTGIRRSGKSVMLELIKEELHSKGVSDTQIISFNFESFVNAPYTTAETLYTELQNRLQMAHGKAYLFFDEIQEVSDWEKCINSARIDFNCDIYITGSNAKLLSGELATYLGGRYVEFIIYPFSFSEYLESRQEWNTSTDAKEAFSSYLKLGGMPFLANFPNSQTVSSQYLKDIYSSVILKDVIKRNNIRDADLLERLIMYIMANVGHPFSARSISNYFKSENRKVAPETVLNYIKACCDAFLFYQLRREDLVGKKILSVNEKYYVADHGLREAIYGNNTRDIEQTLENIVCLEILRRGYQVTIGKVGEKEIDFVATKGDEKLYIQVAYLLASEETIIREFGVYSNIPDNYPKYVITLDEVDFSQNGIKHFNIRDFLLTEEWT